MSEKIQTHQLMLDELLESANTAESPVFYLKGLYKSSPYIKHYMTLSVSETWSTIDINEIKITDYSYHRSMAGALLLNKQNWNIVANVIMSTIAKESSKVTQFKALSEMLYSGERDILKAVLTKDLSSLYPNLSHKVICESLA
jgi:hypothetical protein